MKSSSQLSYPLKALGQVAAKDKALEVVDEILGDEPPGYTRDPERKLDVLRWLTEWPKASSADVVPRLLPYLGDFDENVRWAAVDGLAHHDCEVADAGARLVAALVRREEESGRVKRRIAEVLSEKQIPLGEHADKVPGVLVGPVAGFAVKGAVLVAK
jgi:hypothetical protein